jgi:hypothetical protein
MLWLNLSLLKKLSAQRQQAIKKLPGDFLDAMLNNSSN